MEVEEADWKDIVFIPANRLNLHSFSDCSMTGSIFARQNCQLACTRNRALLLACIEKENEHSW